MRIFRGRNSRLDKRGLRSERRRIPWKEEEEKKSWEKKNTFGWKEILKYSNFQAPRRSRRKMEQFSEHFRNMRAYCNANEKHRRSPQDEIKMIIRNIWKAQLSARVDIKFFLTISFSFFFSLWLMYEDNESCAPPCDT